MVLLLLLGTSLNAYTSTEPAAPSAPDTELEGQLERLARNFGQARGQLFEGKGNVLRRIDGLRALGVTPKKHIKGLEEE